MIERELSYEHYFVGTFLTSSIVNFQAMKSTLANVWHPIGGVSISDIGNERFLFRFYYEVDFWALIHDLLIGFMSETVAQQLGCFIGVSNKEDSIEVMGTLLQVPNSSRSAGLAKQGSNMEVIRHKCSFQSGFDVKLDGRSRDTEGKTWRCTGFYSAPEKSQREASWNLLRALDDCSHIPWLVIDDFNEILYSSEKKGGLPRRELQMTKFWETLSNCTFIDLGYVG
ncbi:hypothetical protein Goarm_014280 [Gossypium armourianum]|uniref:DUF4283 domain-containing protein n=4 Tax=Gossypium TaxID=3633 RepID=A0A7J9J5K3_9ROSI|nr:hypothetical protein [Gossypium armourianum]